jgi:nitrite reductase (NADH) small subunit
MNLRSLEVLEEVPVGTTGTSLWHDVCSAGDLTPDRGVCCLVDGRQIAVFRCSPDNAVFAVSNCDPYCGAYVISRGIVGSRTVGSDVRRIVASPMYRNAFDLETGLSLDDDPNCTDHALATFEVRVVHDRILLRVERGDSMTGEGV